MRARRILLKLTVLKKAVLLNLQNYPLLSKNSVFAVAKVRRRLFPALRIMSPFFKVNITQKTSLLVVQ